MWRSEWEEPPEAHIFECLLTREWNLFRCGLVGRSVVLTVRGGVSLRVSFEVSKAQARPSSAVFPLLVDPKVELSGSSLALPARLHTSCRTDNVLNLWKPQLDHFLYKNCTVMVFLHSNWVLTKIISKAHAPWLKSPNQPFVQWGLWATKLSSQAKKSRKWTSPRQTSKSPWRRREVHMSPWAGQVEASSCKHLMRISCFLLKRQEETH